MGAKISINSATLMNKGLEVIEAARLFGLAEERIGVLVHPQSVIHGLVCYHDGSVLAQLGSPDMRIPIAHTLAWPERMATPSPRLDLAALARLGFCRIRTWMRFPALRLARDALRAGGGAPTILSAANEVAVEAFLQRRIGFLDIVGTVSRVLHAMGAPPADTLDDVIALDAAARRTATGSLPPAPPEGHVPCSTPCPASCNPALAFVVVWVCWSSCMSSATTPRRAGGACMSRCSRSASGGRSRAGRTGSVRPGSSPGCRWAAM